ncbi:unnamed protein product [Linum trigynum]|uniref:Uncharacterized protein n=1 Tax=Linum trigynum TaxID=586398 RepID=A0AAV2E229_9ROSI
MGLSPEPLFNPPLSPFSWLRLVSLFTASASPALATSTRQSSLLTVSFCHVNLSCSPMSSNSPIEFPPDRILAISMPQASLEAIQISSPPSSPLPSLIPHRPNSPFSSPPLTPTSNLSSFQSLDEDVLPSPSCVLDSQEWGRNQEEHPFDVSTLVVTSLDLGRLFNLELDGGQESMEEMIENYAKAMHQRKVRSPGLN